MGSQARSENVKMFWQVSVRKGFYQMILVKTWDMLMFSAFSIAPGTSYLEDKVFLSLDLGMVAAVVVCEMWCLE